MLVAMVVGAMLVAIVFVATSEIRQRWLLTRQIGRSQELYVRSKPWRWAARWHRGRVKRLTHRADEGE